MDHSIVAAFAAVLSEPVVTDATTLAESGRDY
jgi:hypothetical protein